MAAAARHGDDRRLRRAARAQSLRGSDALAADADPPPDRLLLHRLSEISSVPALPADDARPGAPRARRARAGTPRRAQPAARFRPGAALLLCRPPLPDPPRRRPRL